MALKTVPEKVHKELMAENERHRLRKIAILRGWSNRSALADAFGRAKLGVPYNASTISNALNGRKYPGIARELEEYMLDHDGPDLEEDSFKKGA